MERKFDVVIVGAGIIGLSIAYYLKRRGCPRVLVLEKEESWITGSTPRANGGFRQQFSTAFNIQMSKMSVEAFERFESEVGRDIAFHQVGYLFLTAQERVAAGLQENVRLQQGFGVPVRWVLPAEIKQIAPYVETEDLIGGTFCPKDGHADAYSIALGYGEAARDLGAEIGLSEPVQDIVVESGRVTGVKTPLRQIDSPCVINAAGPFAAAIAQMAGLKLPVLPVRRMLVMTEEFMDIPDLIPMTIDLDTGFLMRKESGRVLMGWSDPEEPPAFNLAFDPAIIDIVAEKAVRRVPVLEKVRINPRKSWAGLYEETPDHHCVLGPTPIQGFLLANGFSGHGMMHSPATGMILSDLVMDGRTDRIDIHPVRFSRFEENDLVKELVVI